MSGRACLILVLTLALCGFACTSAREGPPTVPQSSVPPEGYEEGEPPVLLEDLPWTEDFMDRKALLADFVTIEGPEGLITHAVARADNDVHLRSVRTTKEGLLQEYRVRTDAVAAQHTTAIRGQLDGWQIMALRRLIILEKPGSVAVKVKAKGDVFWRDPATGEEKRGDELEWVGNLPE